MGEPQNCVQDERDGPAVQPPVPKVPLAPKASLPPPNIGHVQTPGVASAAVPHSPEEAEAFDEFDPQGSTTAATYTGFSSGTDNFGLSAVDPIDSLAPVPVSVSTISEAHMTSDSDFGANFSSTLYAFNQPSEDPFGESPFKATPQDNNASVQQQKFASVTSIPVSAGSISNSVAQPPEIPKIEPLTSFNNGDSFRATAPIMNGHVSPTTSGVLPPELTVLQPNTGVLEDLHSHIGAASVAPSQAFQPMPYEDVQPATSNIVSQSGLSAPPSQVYPQSFLSQTGLPPPAVPQASPYPFSQRGLAVAAPVSHSLPPNHLSQLGQPAPVSTQAAPNVLSQSGFSAAVGPQATTPSMMLSQAGLPSSGASQVGQAAMGLTAKCAQPNDKFETKSTVWADTLSRGLVNLNISGPKINPLADIGIDFDSINRMEKRKEREKTSAASPVSTVSMGKAMGAGSGIWVCRCMGLTAPPNPMMGSGMGMGTTMGIPGSVGMGMAGVGGYGGGMNQPMGMGMGQGAAASPTGMPSGPAVPGMGYNPVMMGVGGYGCQQFGGYR